MGNRTDDDTATGRLNALLGHLRQRPTTGPAGHSYIPSGPHTHPTESPALVDLSIVDHITAAIREVVADTLAVNPAPSPLPHRVEAAYDWYRHNTANADSAQRQRRDTIIYRQRLEHAIAAGDTSVVRPHRCPACRCFSLFWKRELGKAVCTNGECLTKDSLSHKWDLARLAYEHIAAMSEKAVRDCAT
jgi:hypothetical protein